MKKFLTAILLGAFIFGTSTANLQTVSAASVHREPAAPVMSQGDDNPLHRKNTSDSKELKKQLEKEKKQAERDRKQLEREKEKNDKLQKKLDQEKEKNSDLKKKLEQERRNK